LMLLRAKRSEGYKYALETQYEKIGRKIV